MRFWLHVQKFCQKFLVILPKFLPSCRFYPLSFSFFADFDFFEIHEAFAAQTLATLKAWEDPEFCRERLGRETESDYVREIVDFVTAASDRSFLTPGTS